MHVLKAVAIVTRVHLNISMIFVVSHFLSVLTLKRCPLNEG